MSSKSIDNGGGASFDSIVVNTIQTSNPNGLTINAINGVKVNGPIRSETGQNLQLQAATGKDIIAYNSILPSENAVHSLGRATYRWRKTHQQLNYVLGSLNPIGFFSIDLNPTNGIDQKLAITISTPMYDYAMGTNEIKIPYSGVYQLNLYVRNLTSGLSRGRFRLRRSHPPSFDFYSFDITDYISAPFRVDGSYIFSAATTDRFEIWCDNGDLGDVEVRGTIQLIQRFSD